MNASSKYSVAVEEYPGNMQDVKRPSAADADFHKRVWARPTEDYERFIRDIGFVAQDYVLDAGCGYGQWSAALSRVNKRVTGIDINPDRIGNVLSSPVARACGNLDVLSGDLENMPFESEIFDAVFCYSVVYSTDYNRSIAEIYRVLKPGGMLFVNTNDWGWYIKNLVVGHNDSPGFSSRLMAAQTILNTVEFRFKRTLKKGKNLVMPQSDFHRLLRRTGFEGIQQGPFSEQLFVPSNWYAMRAGYDTLCFKRALT